MNKTAMMLLVLFCVCIGSGPIATADDAEEFWVQHQLERYFDLPQNARAVGMAGSNVATSADVSSLFGNPAGLGWLERPEVSLNYRYDQISGDDFPVIKGIEEDFHSGNFQAAFPFSSGDYGVLGLGVSLYKSDLDDALGTDTDGWRLHAAYAKQFGDQWSWGLSMVYYNDEENNDAVDYEMDDGFRFKLGTQFRPHEDFTLGLSGFYAFGDPDYDIVTLGDQNGDRDSWGLEFGLGWQVWEKTLLAASVDYTRYDFDTTVKNAALGVNQNASEDGDAFGVHVGVEQNLWHWLDVRAGYRYQSIDYDFDAPGFNDFSDADYHAGSAGLGAHLNENVSVDYGFEYRGIGDGDMTHAVTLNFKF